MWNRAKLASSPGSILVLLLTAAPVIASDQPVDRADDLAVLKERLVASCLEGATDGRAAILDLLASMQGTGRFAGVDYDDRSPSSWKTFDHLDRTLRLARALRDPAHPLFEDADLRAANHRALDAWLDAAFVNPNWWWNQIGVPRTLYRILLLLEPTLGREQLRAGLALLENARLGMTGQNLVWVADVTIARGCLEQDPALVTAAIAAITRTITTTLPEGIQADLSFHQHGRCLYSGGYGLAFSVDCARIATLARGTRFAIPAREIDVLSRYILDGQAWMMRGATFDYGGVGREISRQHKTGAGLAAACDSMVLLRTAREPEFAAMARRIRGAAAPADRLRGNRQFWRSDHMAHQRPGFLASVRMHSTRIDNTDDPCNREGLLSHHIADGANLLYRDGREYADLFGVWDWNRIPGATIEQAPLTGTPRHRGDTDFVGGVSDGIYGVAAMDFRAGELVARKSWFFFDDEYVCLGAGIGCGSAHPVLTSIEQRHLRGEVVASSATGVEVVAGRAAFERPEWVLHDRVGYLFVEPGAVVVQSAPQSGSWWRINNRYPDQPESSDVFSLWLDHGTGPRGAGYGYVVMPDVDRRELAARAAAPAVRVLRNTPAVQAVAHDELGFTGAAFFAAGRVRRADGGWVGVDAPCVLLARRTAGRLQLAVSNPRNEALRVAVTVDRQLGGAGVAWDAIGRSSTVRFDLPGGDHGGESVVRSFAVE